MLRIETDIKNQELQFAGLLNNGFLTRIEAMQHLVDANKAVAFRYYLIVVILMLIELMPVIIKSMMPSGPYELQVQTTDELNRQNIRIKANVQRALDEAMANQAIEKNQQATDHIFDSLQRSRLRQADKIVQNWEVNEDMPGGFPVEKAKVEVVRRLAIPRSLMLQWLK